MQSPQRGPVPRVALSDIDPVLCGERREVQFEGADQALEQRAVQTVQMKRVQPRGAGQLALLDGSLIGGQRVGVLAVQLADAADGTDADTEMIAVAVQRVAGDVVVQHADLLPHGQVIVRQNELAQADVAIAGRAELLDTMPVHRQGIGNRGQPQTAATHRCRITVIEHRHLIGREFDDRGQLAGEARRCLPGPAVAKIQVHRAIVQRVCRLDHRTNTRGAAEVGHRAAVVGAQVRNADAELVEAQLMQRTDQWPVGVRQLDFGGETGRATLGQLEAGLEHADQPAQRRDTQRADRQVQLLDLLGRPDMAGKLFDLMLQAQLIRSRIVGRQG